MYILPSFFFFLSVSLHTLKKLKMWLNLQILILFPFLILLQKVVPVTSIYVFLRKKRGTSVVPTHTLSPFCPPGEGISEGKGLSRDIHRLAVPSKLSSIPLGWRPSALIETLALGQLGLLPGLSKHFPFKIPKPSIFHKHLTVFFFKWKEIQGWAYCILTMVWRRAARAVVSGIQKEMHRIRLTAK